MKRAAGSAARRAGDRRAHCAGGRDGRHRLLQLSERVPVVARSDRGLAGDSLPPASGSTAVCLIRYFFPSGCRASPRPVTQTNEWTKTVFPGEHDRESRDCDRILLQVMDIVLSPR